MRWVARGGVLVLAMVVGLVGVCAYGTGLKRADYVLGVVGALLVGLAAYFGTEVAGGP